MVSLNKKEQKIIFLELRIGFLLAWTLGAGNVTSWERTANMKLNDQGCSFSYDI